MYRPSYPGDSPHTPDREGKKVEKGESERKNVSLYVYGSLDKESGEKEETERERERVWSVCV